MISYTEKKRRLEIIEQEEMNDPSLAGLSDKKKKLAIETKKRQEKLAVEDRISHLERFENEEKNHELNVVFPALEDFVGPTKDRQKTDKRWLYPLGVLVLIFLAHGFSAFGMGAPQRLYSGLDYRSQPCGSDHLEIRPYLYWPSPNVDLNVTMCAAECPTLTGKRICLYEKDGKTLHKGDEFCYTAI